MRRLDVARANVRHPLREANVADPNDTLITTTGPILAGFSLAAIVGIGTSASSSRHPVAMAAIAVFALAAVLLLFAIQMLVAAAFPGLRASGGLAGLRASSMRRACSRFWPALGSSSGRSRRQQRLPPAWSLSAWPSPAT